MMFLRLTLCVFGPNIPSDAVLFSLQGIRRHMVSICPITGDITFGFFSNMVSARCCYCKITLFHCNKYLVGKCFETVLTSCLKLLIYLCLYRLIVSYFIQWH